MTKKTVLITGCSSGFGRLAGKTFGQKGWNVIATMRSPEKETEFQTLENGIVTRLDVTDTNSVRDAVEAGMDKFGRIDALVNNAGYGAYGLFEQHDDAAIRANFETNVFGLMNVTREVLPHMRRQKGGSIVNVASVVGMFAAPTMSIYSSAKFAVKGFSEALALELKPLNIHVKTVMPGEFGTNFSTSSDMNFDKGGDELSAYAHKLANHMTAARENMREPGTPEPDAQDVADLIFKCATEDTPVHNAIGPDAEMLALMMDSMSHREFLEKMAGILLPPG